MLNQGGKSGADEPSRFDHSGESARSKPAKIKLERRETRAQRLEVFLEEKACNGAGCPLAWWQWAQDNMRWQADALRRVWDTFCDHWKAAAGSKGIKADWEATWRNWCRRESNFQKVSPLAKGEVRVRETADAERVQIRWDQECLRQRKLPENWRKSDAEIAKLARDALYGSSVMPEVAE